MSRPSKLLLVATFRHYFIGLGLAFNDKQHDYHLVFINQTFDGERNLILNASLRAKEPFASVSCLPLRTTDFKEKNVNRRAAFKLLRKKISAVRPVEISTGNDRRLEFQYAMNFARNVLKMQVRGGFLDQGTGSYISSQKLNMRKYLTRKWVEVPLKKIVYGKWVSKIQRHGESHWVDVCYLTHPNLAPVHLLKKECVEVKADFYKTEQAQCVIGSIVSSIGCSGDEGVQADLLLVVPHGSVIEDIYGSKGRAKEIFENICADYGNVFVKYHPANSGDMLELGGHANILPSQFPVEILFAVMDFERVIGDISTSMVSAKWMLPRASVEFIDTNSGYSGVLRGFFKKLGIPSLGLPFVEGFPAKD